ncbi:MAG: ATP synthase F1 subunit delta [Bacteroidales bacterium]|nr:ATP synthase F1 subunit delta [Bacteroidales bacterium]
MNQGVISTRYARALLKYVGEISDGDILCRQVMTLAKGLDDLLQLRALIESPAGVDDEEKVSLLRTSLGGEMHPSLEKFIRLVLENGRAKLFRQIFHSFTGMYFRSKGILRAKLVSTVPSENLEKALTAMVKEKTGCEVLIESSVDPELIGGFIFTVDDVRFDASVAGQLDTLRRQFIQKNKRII